MFNRRLRVSDSFVLILMSILWIAGNDTAYAESLTVNNAQSEAMAHSPVLKKAQARSDEFKAKKWEGYAGFLPSLSLTGDDFLKRKYLFQDLSFGGKPVSVPAMYPDYNFALRASIPIFDGFQNIAKMSAYSRIADAAKSEETWTQFTTVRDIEIKFYQALAAQRLREVTEQNVKTIQDHLDQTKSFQKGGIATHYDVLRVEVQLSEAQTDLIQAQNEEELSRQRLAVAMGEPDDRRALEGEFPKPDPEILKGVSETKVQRPDLAALGLRLEAADSLDSAAGRLWFPKITFGGQYQLYNNLTQSISDFDQYRSAWNVGIFLNWNLFDANVFSKIGQADAQRVQTEKDLEISQQKVSYDLNYWKRRYSYSDSLYRARVADMSKAEESVRLAREGFKAGVRTNTDVLDSELDLFRAKAGTVHALLGAAEAEINLELALGQKIKN